MPRETSHISQTINQYNFKIFRPCSTRMFPFCVVGRCWVSKEMVIVLTPGMIVSCAPLISTRPSVSPLLAQLAGTRRYLDIMINGSSLDWVATPPARYHTALNIKIHILSSASWNKYLVFHWNLLWYVFLFTFLAADSFYSYQQSFLRPAQRTPVNCGSGVTPESRECQCPVYHMSCWPWRVIWCNFEVNTMQRAAGIFQCINDNIKSFTAMDEFNLWKNLQNHTIYPFIIQDISRFRHKLN